MRTAMTTESDATPAECPPFADIVRQHQGMVFSIAWNFLRDRTLAEELAQDVFLQLHRHLHEMQSAAHVAFWLKKVACHRAIDCARRRKLRPQVSIEGVPEPSIPAAPGDPLLSDMLRRLIGALPEKQRMALILRYQEDLDPAEIAEVLKVPVRTIKSQLQRSLATLRQKLGRRLGEEIV
jgi:RNA polymerase sigma-70 factor (ECF subfamily)